MVRHPLTAFFDLIDSGNQFAFKIPPAWVGGISLCEKCFVKVISFFSIAPFMITYLTYVPIESYNISISVVKSVNVFSLVGARKHDH